MRPRASTLLLIGIALMLVSVIVGIKTSHRHAHPPVPPATDPGTVTFYLDEMTDAPRTPNQKTISWAAFIGFILSVSGSVSLLADGIERFRKKQS